MMDFQTTAVRKRCLHKDSDTEADQEGIEEISESDAYSDEEEEEVQLPVITKGEITKTSNALRQPRGSQQYSGDGQNSKVIIGGIALGLLGVAFLYISVSTFYGLAGIALLVCAVIALLVCAVIYYLQDLKTKELAQIQQEQLLKEKKLKKKQMKREAEMKKNLTEQMQREREEQEEKLKQVQEKMKKEQEEKEEQQRNEKLEQEKEEKRKTEERKGKMIKDLKSSYNLINDQLLILKKSVLKEQNNMADYIDVDHMSVQLNAQVKEIEETRESLKHLLDTNEDKIANVQDVAEELINAVTEFNKKTEDIKKTTASLEEQFTQTKKEYGATPQGRLARSVKAGAVKLKEENGLEIYKLPVVMAHQNVANKLRRYAVGSENPIKPMKHVLMAGMTGAGKSLLINNIVNYLYGVTYKDKFRFQLVVAEEEIEERGSGSKSKAESMTSWVTSFCLHHQPGFLVDYGVTIIDTPGFGDTRGIKYDELIIDQLRNFFNDANVCPVQELSCIGLVIQASQARITEEQKYIYDQVLNIFGRDMTENIFLLFTFADAQPPPALEVVKKEDIPFNKDCTFKFNNSALYAPNNEISSDYSWIFGYDSLKKFFMHLEVVVATNLNMTREVLKERDNLKTLLGNLQKNIDDGMDMLQTIENMINDILALDGTMKANKDHTITSKRYPQTTKVINHNITNCKACMFTCHDPCGISGDQKQGCASMVNGMCGVCPGKCSWDSHSNGDRIYVYEEVEEEVKVEDMLERYNIALTDKNGKKKLLQKMLEEYRCYRKRVFDHISLAARAAKRLEEIALRQTFLTNVTYIERLIESEQRSGRPNKKTRLEQLYHFKKIANTLSQAINCPDKLTECVSKYENAVIQAIDNIEDVKEDFKQYFAYTPPPMNVAPTTRYPYSGAASRHDSISKRPVQPNSKVGKKPKAKKAVAQPDQSQGFFSKLNFFS